MLQRLAREIVTFCIQNRSHNYCFISNPGSPLTVFVAAAAGSNVPASVEQRAETSPRAISN
jgi:hypothetical protein